MSHFFEIFPIKKRNKNQFKVGMVVGRGIARFRVLVNIEQSRRTKRLLDVWCF